MHGTPHPPHTLVQTLHHPPALHLPQLFPTRIAQQLRLLQYLLHLQVPDTDRLLPAVDVGAFDDGVRVGAGRDGDFDGWVGGGEGGEEVR